MSIRNGLLLALAIALPVAAAELQLGCRRDQVITVLGSPIACIQAGGYELLTFERGRVELRDGCVTRVDLISREEAAERRRHAEERYARERKREEQCRRERIAEGCALRDRRSCDPQFLSLPSSEQARVWREFREEYPEVDVDAVYAAVLLRLEGELREERRAEENARRIRDLETRVAAAERRAHEAERRTAYRCDAVSYPPVHYVTHVPCPPVIASPACAPVSYVNYATPRAGVTLTLGTPYPRRATNRNCAPRLLTERHVARRSYY